MNKLFIYNLIYFILIIKSAKTARILSVFVTDSPSHFISIAPLLETLSKRGHEVTVISGFPRQQPIARYRDIPVLELHNATASREFFNNIYKPRKYTAFEAFNAVERNGVDYCRKILQSGDVQNLLHSPVEHFDLVIVELFVSEVLFGLGERFEAPMIGYSAFGAVGWHDRLTGTPRIPSFMPHAFFGQANPMNFWQRFDNTLNYIADFLHYHWRHWPQQEKLYEEYFPNAKRSLTDMRRNLSLILLNQHFSLNGIRPLMPNMIEVGGMHIKRRSASPMPSAMQKFLDDSDAGVIYFSLGSNLKSKDLPREKLVAIMKTFADLDYRVMWKFENSSFSVVPKNVFIHSWLPQAEILSHRNVKLFITHAGLLSITETIYYGKPVIAIPIFGDQFINAARCVQTSIGMSLNFAELNEGNLKAAIEEVITNGIYSLAVQQMSLRYRDQPLTPLETATYWVEYVLRHKGAAHLRSLAADMGFFAYYGLDVIVSIGIVGVLVTLLLVRMVRFISKQFFVRNLFKGKKND